MRAGSRAVCWLQRLQLWLLRRLQRPFGEGDGRFEGCAPAHANDPLVSCSS